MIATINTSSVGLLARVVLALYYMYVFHAVRHGMHKELTMLQKLPTPRAELYVEREVERERSRPSPRVLN